MSENYPLIKMMRNMPESTPSSTSRLGSLKQNHEAHIFVLENARQKVFKHRLRCIKRMEHRTALKRPMKGKGTVVLIIGTSKHEKSRRTTHRGRFESLNLNGC